jgi:hypothetical protein
MSSVFLVYISFMRFPVALILFTLLFSDAYSQGKGRVLTFLNDTAGRQNQFMYVQIGYNAPVLSNVSTAGYGLGVSFGPNLAFLCSKKWTAGIYAGVKWSELLMMIGKFDTEFSNDLNASLQPNNGYAHDSVLTTYFAQQTAIRSQGGGSTILQAGLFFHYPKRFLPLLKIYRAVTYNGVEAYLYDGVATNDFIYLGSKNNFGVSASWSVWQFKSAVRLNIAGYFMQGKLRSYNLEGLWLHEFVAPAFAEKYSKLWRAGITIGIEFY